jgi:hypothetical protein
VRSWDVDTNRRFGDKFHALLGHQVDAPLHSRLVELHIGNAIHEQPTNAVGTLVDGHPVTGPIQLGCTGQT